MATEFYTVETTTEVEYEIKKSRFIGVIMPCQSEDDALRKLGQLARQHPQANHLAFAWRIRQPEGFLTERFHDAGEPSGTAGRPILAPLEGQSLINTVIGVIRYFGGVKLGTGGLTRAYGAAAKQAIAEADIVKWVEMAEMTLEIDYSQLQLLEYQLKQLRGEIIDQSFTDKVVVSIVLPAQHQQAIRQQFISDY
ncbi:MULTISPECIES: YigZ family protein [unclassified Methylophaga]|uniref:YigZ family protein n=1 Tax=unclassified Methylophaga TaxID=2629249 RepID=UPI000C558D1A|nr:YigZ family protein [Methylophaga sp. UBA678]MAX50419.1 YigZ family protein [Methylophaga sp.]|tara:strand:+ start:38630 stop:39214 length:585 start_codon:yes stop_codon:yes gene_type:complete